MARNNGNTNLSFKSRVSLYGPATTSTLGNRVALGGVSGCRRPVLDPASAVDRVEIHACCGGWLDVVDLSWTRPLRLTASKSTPVAAVGVEIHACCGGWQDILGCNLRGPLFGLGDGFLAKSGFGLWFAAGRGDYIPI